VLPVGRSPAVLLVLWVLAVIAVLLPATASAQAWLPVRGEIGIGALAQILRLSGHFDTDGGRLPECVPSRAYIGIAEFEYGFTDKLAFGARLPYVASRFSGHHDELCKAELDAIYEKIREVYPELVKSRDTGAFYATVQDFGFSLRYNLLDRGGTVLTPFVALIIPSHNYDTIGEAAPGAKLRALQVGVSAGRLFDVLPGTYVHARYGYSFVEKLNDIPLNRSNLELEAGYAVTPLVSVRGLLAWERTHGGLTYAEVMDRTLAPDGTLITPFIFLDHDRLLASQYWHVGAGTTVAITDTIDLNAAVLTYVAGAESHYGVGITFGLTFRILPPRFRATSTGTR
jgi:hypothetical protein